MARAHPRLGHKSSQWEMLKQCWFNGSPACEINVGLMLSHRLRRWPRIETTLHQPLAFTQLMHLTTSIKRWASVFSHAPPVTPHIDSDPF